MLTAQTIYICLNCIKTNESQDNLYFILVVYLSILEYNLMTK
jgi:hypothetical protein